MPEKKQERRKVNVATGAERRGTQKDRRRCPDCGSSVRQNAVSIPGGTRTTVYCTSCEWKLESKQVDEEKMQQLLGFEAMVLGDLRKPLLELQPKFLKVAGLKPGDMMSIEPLYAPGAGKSLVWVLKKV